MSQKKEEYYEWINRRISKLVWDPRFVALIQARFPQERIFVSCRKTARMLYLLNALGVKV